MGVMHTGVVQTLRTPTPKAACRTQTHGNQAVVTAGKG